jgi:formylglycine-generating enzyme required for sulfatase activity
MYFGVPSEYHSGEADSPRPYLCDYAEAGRLCELLSDLEAVKVCLPTADQWEMAARGTDGRRYPWGNGFEGDPAKFASPWGLEKLIAGPPEWTSTRIEASKTVICGGEKQWGCAMREPASRDSLRAMRLVVEP